MDREVCHAVIHRVAKSQTRLSNRTELSPLCHLGAPQDARQMQASRKGAINIATIIMGAFYTTLTAMDTSTEKKIGKESCAFVCYLPLHLL